MESCRDQFQVRRTELRVGLSDFHGVYLGIGGGGKTLDTARVDPVVSNSTSRLHNGSDWPREVSGGFQGVLR